MDQIFNEISVSCCYQNDYAARDGMTRIIDVSQALCKLGISPNIRTTRDFASRIIARDYSVWCWTKDNKVDNDLRRYFLGNATKAPYIEDLNQSNSLTELLYNDENALGLGLAYLWDSPSLSLDGDQRFTTDPVNIIFRQMNDEGEIKEKCVEVCTLCQIHQVNKRSNWIRKRLESSVKNGNDLIRNCMQLLPHLKICQNAIDQIKNLTGSEQFFPEIIRHLFTIENGISKWSSGPFKLEGLVYSTDSQSTLSNPKYKEMRKFSCPDNIERAFSLHTKIKTANKRIYFFPIPDEKIVYIGYIGDHLPTISFKT